MKAINAPKQGGASVGPRRAGKCFLRKKAWEQVPGS